MDEKQKVEEIKIEKTKNDENIIAGIAKEWKKEVLVAEAIEGLNKLMFMYTRLIQENPNNVQAISAVNEQIKNAIVDLIASMDKIVTNYVAYIVAIKGVKNGEQ